MKVLHDFPKEVVDTIERLGIIVDEQDCTYFNLPQWFRKDKDGKIFEVSFNEVSEQTKRINLLYMNLHQIIEVHDAPYFRVMRVVGGWLYNFYDEVADNYKTDWVFVAQLPNQL